MPRPAIRPTTGDTRSVASASCGCAAGTSRSFRTSTRKQETMPDPLEIRLSAPKERFTVGEGVVLELAIRVAVELDMETVELNRSRTHIFVSPLASNQPAMELTGQDHIARFAVHPLSEVGISFHAPAGSEWTVQLELLKYTSALSAGRYQIALLYRYG